MLPLAIPLLALGASAGLIPRQNAQPQVVIYPANAPDSGVTLTGQRDLQTGTDRYTSIPYAAPPVGDLRWKAPIQPTWNTSTYNATSVIPTCLQAPNGLAGRNGSVIGEDCLYLDVYTPAGVNATADLPVFVWIYGGSFTAGSAQTYDARVLLAAGGQTNRPFIAVVPNYRVGILGFPYGKQAADIKAGNLGIRDVKLALEWTRDNIGAFGGSADKVTLAGESAGAIITNLLLLQKDLDLFRSAIIQSGGVSVSPIGPIATTWQQPFDLFTSTIGCSANTSSSTSAAAMPTSSFKSNIKFGANVAGLLDVKMNLPGDLKLDLNMLKKLGKNENDKGQGHGKGQDKHDSKPTKPKDCNNGTDTEPTSPSSGQYDGLWECLRGKTAEEVLAAQVTVLSNPLFSPFSFAPSIDGDLIPDSPHKLLTNGEFRAVPMINGNMKDEGTLFIPTTIAGEAALTLVIDVNQPIDPDNATLARVYELYPADPALGSPFDTGNNTFGLDPTFKRAAAIFGDSTFQAARRWQTRQQVAYYPDAPVYSYLFTQPIPDGKPYLGVSHGQDVFYTFGFPLLGGNYTQQDQAFDLQYINYWINFVYSQNPNSPVPPTTTWPAYNDTSATGQGLNMLQLQFGAMEVIQDDYREEQIAFFNSEPEQFNLKRRVAGV